MLSSRKCSRFAGRFVRTAVLAVVVIVAAAAAGCKDSQEGDDRSDRRGSVQRNGDDYNYPRVLLHSRSMAQALKDKADVKNLLLAIYAYANSHNGKFPPSLDALAEDDSSVRKLLTYEDGEKRFEYVTGLSHYSQGDSVIVYEATADQDKKRFVGRVNGVIDLLDEEQFAAATKR